MLEETERVDQQEEVSAAKPTRDFSADEEKSGNNEKSLVPIPLHQLVSPTTEKDAVDYEVEKIVGKLKDGDIALAQVETEKRLALIKAWEDNEKTKADNKAYKKLSAIEAWENTKRASIEAQLKQIEERIEMKKAEFREKMKNKMGIVHKEAEEKRALVKADQGQEFLLVEEAAAKYRARGTIPKKLFSCFSC